MSHSSGIAATPALVSLFSEANGNNVRAVKVVIKDDQLQCEKTIDIQGDFEADLDRVPALLDTNTPCFVLVKTDTRSIEVTGYNWLFMFYVPEIAKVREKMTYSSSKAALKRELGNAHFVDEINSSVPKDFSKKGYKEHKTHQNSDAPLTLEEQQRNEEREQGVFVGGGGAGMRAHGVAFPVEDRASEAVHKFIKGSINYVQLAINIQEEKVVFIDAKNLDVSDISSVISTTEARFYFYRYSHQHEGQKLDSIIYIFYCPDGSNGTKSAPVKMRMLYSSSKSNVESLLGDLKIDLKMEINSPPEISESIIETSLHPPKPEEKKAFTKPARPGAGARKLINK